MKALKILVVDDSLITVRRLSAMVETMGHRVVATASSGTEAVQAYRAFHPDVVTMDITMPGMDGIEATRQILGEFPDAKVIVVTSIGQEHTVIDALDAGADGYVLKPVREDKLVEMIASVINPRPIAGLHF